MDRTPIPQGEILLYENGGEKEFVSVVFQDETFWLTQSGMAELFDCSTDNISLHLKNIYAEEELTPEATTEKISVVRQEGTRQVCRTLDHYNLDAIIAVGYRVNSKKATRFRQWATLDSPTMGLTTWKGAPDGKILKSDVLVAKNYLNEKEISRLNRLVTMFIDYAELMAEDEQLMSMEDWLRETDRFLANNRRNVLEGKGHISRDQAVKKVGEIYEQFRKKQDADYISDFDRAMEQYLKGGSGT